MTEQAGQYSWVDSRIPPSPNPITPSGFMPTLQSLPPQVQPVTPSQPQKSDPRKAEFTTSLNSILILRQQLLLETMKLIEHPNETISTWASNQSTAEAVAVQHLHMAIRLHHQNGE